MVAGDFEDLAREASTSVARATAIGAPSDRALGRVGLVVVPRSDDDLPAASRELIDRVDRYVRERSGATFDVWVGSPGWWRVDVSAEVVPVMLEQATDVENAVRGRVRAFLHPLSGGDGSGWPLGRRVFRSDVEAVIHAMPGVDHVRFLKVTERVMVAAPAPDAFFIYSGEHSIRVAGG